MLNESEPVFDPDEITWDRVSPSLKTLRRLVVAITHTIAFLVATLNPSPMPWWLRGVAGGIVLGFAVWEWWLIGRQVAALGYIEREDDLLIRRGIMFRRLVVVPYGRMQYVDVKSGPLERLFSLASVQLHTASPGSNASIPGLNPEEAARMRDRLTTRGEAQMAGL